MNPRDFGSVLKEFRTRRGLTQQQLADKLSMRRNTVGSWERGDFLPGSKGVVLELARHLHLDDQEARQLLEASFTAPVPYWFVPLPRNPYFTGREEILEALHTQLGVDQAVALTQSSALHGLGGVGKTQIALEYAYRHALEYSAVFWLGAEMEESVISSLLRVASVLQLPECNDPDQQRVVASVQRWLATHAQWLVIWDNVEDLAPLDRFLPSTRSGAILLTTRCQALGTRARGIDLLPMEQEEGILFLLRRAKVLESDAESQQVCQLAVQMPHQYAAAAELVTALGGLPLALDQAGAYIEEAQCTLSTYLDLFRTQRAALLTLRGDRPRMHPESVSTTFTLSIMATAQRHAAVQDLLRVCALLDPDAIPEELFRQGARCLGAPLEAACRDLLAWNQVITTACSYSLLSRQPEEQTLSIHRLVQAVLVDTMTETEQERQNQRAMAALDEIFPNVQRRTEQTVWKRAERVLPHALLCLRRTDAGEASLVLASLAYKAAQYLYVTGRYAEAEPLYQRALSLREQVLGPEHSDRARSLTSLAVLYVRQGRYAEAEPLYQRALPMLEQALGPDHPEMAAALSSLAILYSEQGRYGEAEPLFHWALSIREQVLGPDHPDIAGSLINLAGLYSEQGKYGQAEPLLRRVVLLLTHALGPTHPELGSALTNLALIISKQGGYEEAEPLYQRALSILEHTLGPDHLEVARVFTNLADLHREQGRDAEAEALYRRMLAIWEQRLGPDSAKLAEPLTGLAGLCHEQGRDGEAEALYQRALSLWEQHFGPEHLGVAPMLTGLADLRRDQDREAEAESLYQRALSIREQEWGGAHPDVAQTLHGLALLRQKQGHVDEAVSLAERALQIRLQMLGNVHPYTMASQALSAQLLQKQAGVQKEATPPQRYAEEIPGLRGEEFQAERISPSFPKASRLSLAEDDSLQKFLGACCELYPRAWCRSADLWQAYTQWATEHQERYPLSRGAFIAQLKKHGCRADRTKTARIWRGIALANNHGDGG